MRRMKEARLLQASRSIFSYVVPSASDLIKQVRDQVFSKGIAVTDGNSNSNELEIIEVLGEGAFGKVNCFFFIRMRC